MSEQTATNASFLLQERGLFWWADHPIPPEKFAPPTSVPGELKIDRSGRITLDLEHVITEGASPMAALMAAFAASDDARLRTRQIRGLLKESSRHVLLCNLTRRGGRFASSNISYESFRAAQCLVGNQEFPTRTQNISFAYVEVDLEGFEEWLVLGSLFTKRSKTALHLNYRRPKSMDYVLGIGTLSFIYDLYGPPVGESRVETVTLREAVAIRFKKDRRFSISESIDYYSSLQDFFDIDN